MAYLKVPSQRKETTRIQEDPAHPLPESLSGQLGCSGGLCLPGESLSQSRLRMVV